MNAPACPREDELLESLGNGFVGAELASHAEVCATCSELRAVAAALLDERGTAAIEAVVPASGTMWWRLQIRRRSDAQAAARRVLFVGQAVTLGVAAVVTAVLFGAQIGTAVRTFIATLPLNTPLLVAGASLLLAPLAGWVAIRQK
jgi:hypothetical protein